jgi:hypothetical protein
LHGPAQAAAGVVTGSPSRILYCGKTDGSFIFAVRCLDPEIRTVVIRGEKLPASTFNISEFENLAHRYGINYIILEHGPDYRSGSYSPAPWDSLRTAALPNLELKQVIPLTSSSFKESFKGSLYVYRFTNPSRNPENLLKQSSRLINDNLDLKFQP